VESLAWDSEQHRWRGLAALDADSRVEVVVIPGEVEPAVALAYARFAFSQLASRVGKAQRYAARRLLDYYNCYNAHLQEGEQLTEEAFARRLRLEGIRFTGEGSACLDFGHDLYRGDRLYEGGRVVVEASADGHFRRASWVTRPDAEEPRLTRS
jgi:hypothetical protein